MYTFLGSIVPVNAPAVSPDCMWLKWIGSQLLTAHYHALWNAPAQSHP
jgi:hypothetical protein